MFDAYTTVHTREIHLVNDYKQIIVCASCLISNFFHNFSVGHICYGFPLDHSSHCVFKILSSFHTAWLYTFVDLPGIAHENKFLETDTLIVHQQQCIEAWPVNPGVPDKLMRQHRAVIHIVYNHSPT